jgi:hypothetical protein
MNVGTKILREIFPIQYKYLAYDRCIICNKKLSIFNVHEDYHKNEYWRLETVKSINSVEFLNSTYCLRCFNDYRKLLYDLISYSNINIRCVKKEAMLYCRNNERELIVNLSDIDKIETEVLLHICRNIYKNLLMSIGGEI